MNLYINSEKMDFSLENEKNLCDVMKQINQWIRNGHHFIDLIIIDGKEIELEEAINSSLFISDINNIEISTKGYLDQIEEVVPMIKNYLFKYMDEIEKGKESFCINKREKIEGLVWVLDSISLVSNNLNIQPRHIFSSGRNLEEVLSFMKVSVNTLLQGIHDSEFFYSYFKEGILPRLPILERMIHQVLDFYNYLIGSKNQNFVEEFLKEGSEVSSGLKEIPMMLQEGKDQDALSMIQKVMCYFEALNISITKSKLPDAKKAESDQIKQEIMDLFNQCYESFKVQDIVTVSDIIEYEIDEKIKVLADYLKSAYALI